MAIVIQSKYSFYCNLMINYNIGMVFYVTLSIFARNLTSTSNCNDSTQFKDYRRRTNIR
jgi:hypothetical protein